MVDQAAPPVVRPDVQAFVDLLAAQPGPSFAEMGAAAARDAMAMMGQMFEVETGPLARIEAITAIAGDDGRTIPLRLYDNREERGPSPVVVFYHGGGFVLGDLDCYDPGCAAFARGLDLPVVSVDYRLAPEHAWPAAPDDCEAATRWIAGAGGLGFPVTGLILAGDSAGGGLAIVSAMALRDAPATVPVEALMALYPVTEQRLEHPSYAQFGEGYVLQRADMRWFLDSYGADRAHWRASPLAGSAHAMPPTLIAAAGLDPLRDEGRAYAAASVTAGVPTIFYEAEGMIHGFLSLRKAMPSAERDLAHCMAMLRQMIAPTPGA